MDKITIKLSICLGKCLELLSAWLVIAVCQDSSVFLTREQVASVNDACILKINSMAFEPRMAGNIGAIFKNFGVSYAFLFYIYSFVIFSPFCTYIFLPSLLTFHFLKIADWQSKARVLKNF